MGNSFKNLEFTGVKNSVSYQVDMNWMLLGWAFVAVLRIIGVHEYPWWILVIFPLLWVVFVFILIFFVHILCNIKIEPQREDRK